MPHAQLVSLHLQAFRDVPGGLLPLLHAIQRDIGYIPPNAINDIAQSMNLSRAEVHGVISFYEDFRIEPVGQHVLQICRAEACQSMGALALEAHAKQSLGIDYGQTTSDGHVTLQAVYCLGNCACSPTVRIDDEIHARVDAERLDELLASTLEGEGA